MPAAPTSTFLGSSSSRPLSLVPSIRAEYSSSLAVSHDIAATEGIRVGKAVDCARFSEDIRRRYRHNNSISGNLIARKTNVVQWNVGVLGARTARVVRPTMETDTRRDISVSTWLGLSSALLDGPA